MTSYNVRVETRIVGNADPIVAKGGADEHKLAGLVGTLYEAGLSDEDTYEAMRALRKLHAEGTVTRVLPDREITISITEQEVPA